MSCRVLTRQPHAVPGKRSPTRPQDLDAWATEPSTLADVTLRDNVDAVVDVVRRVAEHGPVVLVAAGLGGLTISGAGNVIPDLVDRLVYISAWSCVRCANPIEYMQEPEFAGNLMAPLAAFNVGDPARLGVGRPTTAPRTRNCSTRSRPPPWRTSATSSSVPSSTSCSRTSPSR
ncbi:hypothetical protein ABZ815_47010 [Nonomuraea sp. NPDC047529]|uniref:hypothetical protein n=1 Tax=Nonomuraea sp. NPDC047529 TaxID=3155623 RepID=UPI0033C60941